MKITKFLLMFSLFSMSWNSEIFGVQSVKDVRETNHNIKVYGEYLYWKVSQDQMQYAALLPGGIQQFTQQVNPGVTNLFDSILQQVEDDAGLVISEKLKLIDPDCGFHSGFRIGLGYEAPCSPWDFEVMWVRLHQNSNSHISDSTNGIIPTTVPASAIFGFINADPTQFAFASGAESHWKFDLDVIDFQIGRICNPTQCVYLRPYLGVKGAIVNQHQKITYLGYSINNAPINVQNTKKNNFNGVGPSLGFNSSWEICPRFNLTSGICGALLVGKFDVSDNPKLSQDNNSIQVKLDNSTKCRVRPVVDANIGIDWTPCLCGNRYNVVIGISYEVQYWWNQWQVPASTISGIINSGESPKGDLMMQGITVKAGVAF
jgi:hypothetical protein